MSLLPHLGLLLGLAGILVFAWTALTRVPQRSEAAYHDAVRDFRVLKEPTLRYNGDTDGLVRALERMVESRAAPHNAKLEYAVLWHALMQDYPSGLACVSIYGALPQYGFYVAKTYPSCSGSGDGYADLRELVEALDAQL